MKFVITFFMFLSLGIIFVSCQKKTEDKPEEEESISEEPVIVSYGLSNSTGEYLFISFPDSIIDVQYFVVTPEGDTSGLSLISKGDKTDPATGEEMRQNFEGPYVALYKPAINLPPYRTYFVVNSSYLSSHQPLAVKHVPVTPASRDVNDRISNEKGTEIKSSWKTGSINDAYDIIITEFQPGKDTALASLVLINDSVLISEDYIGNPQDEYSVWRVDDGGEFSPETIEIIAAFKSDAGIEIVRLWLGAEGENLAYLVENGDKFESVNEAYRYMGY